MGVEVSELRIVGSYDPAQYEAGARRKVQADQQMIASDRAVGESAKSAGSLQKQAADDAAAASQRRTQAAQAEVATETRREQAIRTTVAQLDAMARAGAGVARIDALMEQTKTKLARAEAAQAAAVNGTTQEQIAAARAVDALRSRIQTLDAARTREAQISEVARQQMLGTGQAAKLTAFQLQNLSFQINDVVTGLITGQRPMQVMAQQGGQIVQVFGGVGATLGRLLNPVTAMIAGMAALALGIGTVVGRAVELERQLRAVQTSLQGTGNAGGFNAGDVQNQVNQFARLVGVDRSSALATAQGALQNPLLSPDQFARLLPLARNYAAITGQEIPAAAKALSDALSGGYDAALKLDRQFQLLTQSELEQIRTLEQQGRKQEAANILLAAAERQFKGAADRGVLPLDQAVKDLSNTWNDLLDNLARSDAFETAKKHLEELLRIASGKSSGGGVSGTLGTNPITGPFVGIANAMGLLAQLFGPSSAQQINQQIGAPNVSGGINDATRLMQQLSGAMHDVATAGPMTKGALHDLGTSADQLVRQLDPAGTEMKRLEDQQVLLTNAMANGLITVDQYAKAMAMLGIAMANVQTPENLLQALREQAKLAGMAPGARAGEEQAKRMREAGGTQADVDEARRLGQRIYGAGQGYGFGQELTKLGLGVRGAEDVAKAYAVSEAAGRKAETQLKALQERYELGAAAVKQYADALLAQDAAQRKIEGAKQLRSLEDEVADQQKLTAALAQSTDEYERQKIAIEAARKAEQGYLTSPQDVERYTAAREKQRLDALAREAIQINEQFDANFAFDRQLKHFEELQKQGKLTAEATRSYLEDMYIKAGRAGDSWLDGAASGLLEFARQARNVGAAVADALVQAFSVGTDALARLLLGMTVNVKQALNDIRLSLARAFIGSTITGPIAGALGGFLGGTGGLGSALGGGAVSIGGVPYVPANGGGGGLFGNLFGGGGIPGGGLFGNSGIGGFLSQPLFGAGGLFGAGLTGSIAGSLAGGGSLGALAGGSALAGGGSLAGALGGLFGIGTGIFSLAQGNTIGGITGLLGGGLGLAGGLGLLGSWAGPAGAVIGLLGGLLGGLFKKKPKTPQEVSNIFFGPDGITNAIGYSRGKSLGSTGPAAGAFGTAFQDLLDSYGLSTTSGFGGGWILNSIGKNTGNQWIVGTGAYNPGDSSRTIKAGLGSAEDAINYLAAALFKQGAASGTLQGLSVTQQRAINSTDLTSIDEIKKALDFSNVYDEIIRGSENITAAEKAVKDLNDQFKSLSSQAKQYGLDVAALEQKRVEAINKLATDTNEDYRRRILGLTPEGALQVALEDLDKAREDALKNAEYLNQTVTGALVDINQIEDYYSKQRVAIIENANKAANDSLETLWRRLTYGDLSGASPLGTLEGTQSAYEAALAAAQGGDLTARGNLAGLAEDYVRAGYAYNGPNAAQGALVSSVADAIAPFFTGNDNVMTALNTTVTDYARIWAEQQATITRLLQKVEDLVAANQDLTERLARAA